jgi:hypothetical protein
VSHQTLISVGETTAIVETKAKGFQEHISFESTAFKEHGWDLTKQYISVGETPADSRKSFLNLVIFRFFLTAQIINSIF